MRWTFLELSCSVGRYALIGLDSHWSDNCWPSFHLLYFIFGGGLWIPSHDKNVNKW